MQRSRSRAVIPIALCAFLILGAMSFWTVQPAYACSCVVPPAPREARDVAEEVFAGEVIDITPIGTGGHLTVHFAVSKAWKGVDHQEIEIGTPGGPAACGYEFQEGEEYLVYTYRNSRGPGPETASGLCQRTAELSAASEDLDALGEGISIEAVDQERVVDTPASDMFDSWLISGGIGLILAIMRWLHQQR